MGTITTQDGTQIYTTRTGAQEPESWIRSRLKARFAWAGGLLRQEQREGGALPGLAARLYGAAVGLGDLAGDGEPQPRPARRARGIGPVEALEDKGQLGIRNTDAGVGDLELYLAVLFTHPHHHLAPLGRVLHGVVQKDAR
jgi:hypothetical protein